LPTASGKYTLCGSQDLAAEDLVGHLVLVADDAQQGLVPLVSAVHGIREVEIDERGLDEEGIALVLRLPDRGGVAGIEVDRVERSLGGDDVRHRPSRGCLVGDVRAARPGSALPELARLGVRSILRDGDALGVCQPGRHAARDRRRIVGRDVRPVERFGVGPGDLRAEAQGRPLVFAERPAAAWAA
jgi:hypothetical protein